MSTTAILALLDGIGRDHEGCAPVLVRTQVAFVRALTDEIGSPPRAGGTCVVELHEQLEEELERLERMLGGAPLEP